MSQVQNSSYCRDQIVDPDHEGDYDKEDEDERALVVLYYSSVLELDVGVLGGVRERRAYFVKLGIED